MKFPIDTAKTKAIKSLTILGFVVVREGNHIIMERSNPDGTKTPLVLPNHQVIKSSTLRSILTQSSIKRDEFLNAYYTT